MRKRKNQPTPLVPDLETAKTNEIRSRIPMWKERLEELIASADFDTSTGIMSAEIVARLRIIQADALSGNRMAFQALVALSRLCMWPLETAGYLHREEEQELARNSEVWPVLLSAHRNVANARIRRIQELPLGKNLLGSKTRTGAQTRDFDPENIAHRILDQEIPILRLENPTLYGLRRESSSPEALSALFDMVWQQFVRRRPTYWEIPKIRHLGEAFAEAKKMKKDGEYPVGSPTYEANVRDGIKQRLREAFQRRFHPKD